MSDNKIPKIDDIVSLVNSEDHKKFEEFKKEYIEFKPSDIYKFGKVFKNEKSRFIELLNILDKKLNEKDDENLALIKAILVVNLYNNDYKCISNYFEINIQKYNNPYFRYIFSCFLFKIDLYEKAKDFCLVLLDIDPKNKLFIELCFNVEKEFFGELLKQGKIRDAENYFVVFDKNKLYQSNLICNNALIFIKDRLEDHKIISEKISGIDEIIKKKLEEERNKIIEMLGIFTGILGFVFANINIALNNLKMHEVMWLMLEMAVIFLVFAISISFVFREDKEVFYKQGKFKVLIILIAVIILGIFSLSKKEVLLMII